MSQDKNTKENTNEDLLNKVEDTEKEQNTKDIIEEDQEKEGIIEKSRDKEKKYKSILTISLIAIIGLGAGFYIGKDVGRGLPATHKYYSKSEVLATVDDVKITGDDFRKRVEPYFYQQGLKKLSNEEIESYEANTINYMTNLEALYKAGKEEGIKVTDKDLKSNYDNIVNTITSYLNLSEDEFLKKFDLTSDYIKNSLEKEVIATEYLTKNSKVSEKEAKNYYDKNKEDFFEISASHILISNTDKNGEQVSDKKKKENKELAEKLLKRVQKGESIEDLALEYSDDTNTASEGGDLQYFSKGEMNENFEKAAFSLKVGEVYPKVVETTYGYHIIKKTGEQYINFDDVKESLIESLTSDKQSNLLQDALEKYNVKVNM